MDKVCCLFGQSHYPFYVISFVCSHLCKFYSDTHGDRPRPLPAIEELKGAKDVTERKGAPAWDYDVSN